MTESVHVDAVPETLSPEATVAGARDDGVGVWWQLTAFVEVAGADAVSFIDGVTTQAVERIEVGTARHALFLTTKARIVAPTLAYRVADDRVVLELDPALVDELCAHLRRYRLRAKATIEPVDLATVAVVGPASRRWLGPEWLDSPAWGVPASTFLGDAATARAIVAERFPAEGIGLAEPEALDAVRIDAGVPSLADLLPGSMPAEVGGMEVAVALDKGCYLGQEPVARLHFRGKANRTLRPVTLDHELPDEYFDGHLPDDEGYLGLVAPDAGDAERPLGRLTSWAAHPRRGLVGLAVLRREVAPGTRLRVAGSDVTVTAEP